MKRLFLLIMCTIIMGSVSLAFGQEPSKSESAKQESIKIIPIEELARKMETRLFAAADQTLVKKYLSADGAPASMSSFVLFADEEIILFDTGLGGETWVKKLTDAGVQPEKVTWIFLTHQHGDHIGGLFQGNNRRFPNARVLCSEQEYESGLAIEGAKIKSAYGMDYGVFKFDAQVFENDALKIKALDASGHTPGHTAFLIESPQDKFLVIGDLLHAAALQFPAPDVCASYDADLIKAVASRKRILDMASQEKLLLGGMHLPAPHTGKVEKMEQGGYLFQPSTKR